MKYARIIGIMRSLRTFFLRTYGCQMNELDSEVMAGMLERRGLIQVQDELLADLLLFNTCSVRDLAERKVLGKIGKLHKSRKDRPIIGITGCMASSKKEMLLKKLPFLDFVLGTNNIHLLSEALDLVLQEKRVMLADDTFTHELAYDGAKRKDPLRASVSIIRGCNKHCTYCIVPYTRGKEVSRHPDDIIDECKRLIDCGYKEITLLGQNVNSYGKDKPEWNMHFHDLLGRIDALHSVPRIRFLTSHPVDITEDLMKAMRDLSSICEYVHFPLQAGTNRVLKKMNRGYTKEQYREKVSLLRQYVPDVALGTDIITGFPTETESEFLETREALKEFGFSAAFLFAYSARNGTPASRWIDDIPQAEKDARLQVLLETQETIVTQEAQKLIGSVVEVLVEETSSKDFATVKGRTRTWKPVVFPGNASMCGTLQNVKLVGISHQTFLGEHRAR
jgi:tRNA-2-methylthio-N6-dimethylallyladenosine synthase